VSAIRLSREAWFTSPRIVDRLCRDFELLVPLVRWLNRALGCQPTKARR
jgi:hypothetical protein